jgi:predicted Zn-dependent protease
VSSTPAFEPTRDKYLEKLVGLTVGPDPAQGMFDGTRFLHADMDLQLRFPSEWRTQNSGVRVAAGSPRGDAMITLELQGHGDDPHAAAEQFLAKQPLRVVSNRPLRVAGLRAFEVVGSASDAAAHLTWIAYRGSVYRISGLAAPAQFRNYDALFQRTAESFRPLTPAERALFKRRSIEIAIARDGETLEALGKRTGNAWGIEQTAVSNGLRPGDPLPPGMHVKIATEKPYQPG